MSLYSKIERRMWGDAKFRKFSRPAPNARDLWIYLLTGPHNTSIPGLFVLGEAAMADAMEWPVEETKVCFAEILASGTVRYDPASRLVWLPNALRHNQPRNSNVVVGWRAHWQVLPECSLRDEARDALIGALTALGRSFAEAFAIARGDAPPKASTNPSGVRPPNPPPVKTENKEPTNQPKDKPNSSVGDPANNKPTQDQEQEQKGDGAGARAGTRVEHTAGQQTTLSPEDILDTLSKSSGGTLGKTCGAPQLAELIRLCATAIPAPLTIADLETLGRAHAAKAAWPWKSNGKSPDVGYLVKDGGKMLFEGIETAREWARKLAAPARGAASDPFDEIRTPSKPAGGATINWGKGIRRE